MFSIFSIGSTSHDADVNEPIIVISNAALSLNNCLSHLSINSPILSLMAAVRASLASSSLTIVASTSYSSSSYSSLFSKFRSIPLSNLSFSVNKPFLLYSPRRGKRMAHALARATLGLTHPSPIDSPKVYLTHTELHVLILFLVHLLVDHPD